MIESKNALGDDYNHHLTISMITLFVNFTFLFLFFSFLFLPSFLSPPILPECLALLTIDVSC